jgi:hypothetical protein
MNCHRRVLTSVFIATIMVIESSQAAWSQQSIPLTSSSPATVSTAAPINSPAPAPARNHTMTWVQAGIGALVAVLIVGSVIQARHCHLDPSNPVCCESNNDTNDNTDNFDDTAKRHRAFGLQLRIPLGIIHATDSPRR